MELIACFWKADFKFTPHSDLVTATLAEFKKKQNTLLCQTGSFKVGQKSQKSNISCYDLKKLNNRCETKLLKSGFVTLSTLIFLRLLRLQQATVRATVHKWRKPETA